MTKAEIVRLVEEGYARLESTLALFSDAQMASLVLNGDWTIRDTLAHIAYWERQLLGWLNEAAHGQKPGVPDYTDEQLNRVNGDAVMRSRQLSLPDLLADFRRVHRELVAALHALPDDPQDRQWTLWQRPNGITPWEVITNNTYEHYDEHVQPMLALNDPPRS